MPVIGYSFRILFDNRQHVFRVEAVCHAQNKTTQLKGSPFMDLELTRHAILLFIERMGFEHDS